MKKKIAAKKELTNAQISRIKKNNARRIKRANEKFAKLTPAQKRVAIAKDVLLQMEVGFIKPTSGVWADFPKNLPEDKPNTQLQSFLETQNSCKACGLGSLFVCAVKLFDNLKVGEVIENTKKDVDILDGEMFTDGVSFRTIFSYLKKFFSKDQLKMIECAFEEDNGYFSHQHSSEAITLGGRYFNNINIMLENFDEELSTKMKLKLIMQNIIKNNGTFKADEKNMPKFSYEIIIPGYKD